MTQPIPYRTAFITGASSGIGLCLAERLAQQGVHVALAARRKTLLDELAKRLRDAGHGVSVYPLDVADPEAVLATVQKADAELNGLDLVIANAGVSLHKPSAELDWEHCATMIDTNLRGAVATLIAVLPRMVERKRGHLVGISSLAQYRGLPQGAVYSASKAFLSTFLESLRVDLRGTGVYVSDIRPGFIRTPMTAKNQHPMPFLMDAEVAAQKIERAIVRKKSVYAFPWLFAQMVRSLRVVPNLIYDPAVCRLRATTSRT